jgi:endonuclease/exonuclease/phosphatase family metal-dependent hydrolase
MGHTLSRRTAAWAATAVAVGCTIPHTMTNEPERTCLAGPQGPTASALTWFVPTEAADRRALDAWCSAVGPVVIDSMPDASLGAWQDGDSLAVVIWNLEAGSATLLEFLERELHIQCGTSSPSTGDAFSHFVLLAQEALRRSPDVPPAPPRAVVPPRIEGNNRPTHRMDIVEVARQCRLALAYVPAVRNGYDEYDGEREDWGNAVLATLPLTDFVAIEIPFETSRRVAVGATIHGPGGDSLRVVSLHISTFPGPWRIFRTGNSSRARQALGFVEALRRVEVLRLEPDPAMAACYPRCPMDSPNPPARYSISTVAGGDLNTWSADETALQHLREHFPDSPRDDRPTRGPFPTDHLLLRTRNLGVATYHLVPGSYQRIEDSYNSDHRARRVWIRAGQ